MSFKCGAIKNGLFGPIWSYHTRFSVIEIPPFSVVFNWGISINHQSAFFLSVYCTSNRRYPNHSVTIMMTLCSSQTSHTLKISNIICKQKHLPCNAGNINNWYFSQEKRLQYVHQSILNLWPVWPMQTLLNLTLYMLHDLFIHVRLMMYRHQNV